jgi:DNA polymerase-3 subunit delta'
VTFRDILGHERAKAVFGREIATGRVYQAHCLIGIAGIGKRRLALAFAKALNCGSRGSDACGTCPVCRRIDKGLHPDVMVIVPEGETIRIDQIRDVQRAMGFKPFEARWRVVIIDGAERMTREAANALLRTLEEPPPGTALVLMATAVDTLPPTVLSRCHRIHCNPLPPEQVHAIVSGEAPPSEVDLRVTLGGGSPGRALALDSEVLEGARTRIVQALGAPLAERLRRAHEVTDRGEARALLELLSVWVRDLIIYRETQNHEALLNDGVREQIGRYADALDTRQLLGEFWLLNEVQRSFDARGNLNLSLDTAMVSLKGAMGDETSWH